MAPVFGLLPASSKLCESCAWERDNHETTSIAGGNTAKGQRYRYVKIAQKASREGCWPCGLYLAAIEQLWVPDEPDYMTGQGQFYLRYDAEQFTIQGQVRHPHLQIYSVEGRPKVYRFPQAPEIPLRAASSRTYKFIKDRLDDCVRNHMACRKASQGLDEKWPRRILRIDPATARVRLVSFDRSMDQRYTALSYCWGPGTPPFRATRDTLPALTGPGVGTAALPRTIADAVRFSLNIGSDLIWVDSMCIVQDDPGDWDEESCKMSTVYRHALVTIIASSAASCEEGFLDRKRHASVLLLREAVPQEHQQQYRWAEVRARKVCESGHHRPPRLSISPEHRRPEPVDTRGWTLQEKLLSPRCAVFTSSEAQWECREARACECGQLVPPPPPPPPSSSSSFSSSPPSSGESVPATTTTTTTAVTKASKTQEAEREWFGILEDYTGRALSVDADRLTALAGVSRAMSWALPNGRFAAGVWVTPEPTALTARGLLWGRVASLMRPAYCPQAYLAPSWSWASVVGEVSHAAADKFAPHRSSSYPSSPPIPCTFLARVLEVDVIAAAMATTTTTTTTTAGAAAAGGRTGSVDPFSRVAFGLARVRGTLLRTRLRYVPTRWRDGDAKLALGWMCHVDVPLERVRMPGGGFTVQRRTTASAEESDRLFDTMEFPETEVSVLPILQYQTDFGTPSVEALVLGRSPTLAGYQRLGRTWYSLSDQKRLDSTEEDICIF